MSELILSLMFNAVKIFALPVQKKSRTTTPVVIIENEIGNAGVDDQLLKNQGLTVKNLFAGCASQAQLEDTVSFLKKEHAPQWLIIEATGLAYPDKIKVTVEDGLGLNAGIIAIVDASRWFRLIAAMAPFVAGQLAHASGVLVNKIDCVSTSYTEAVIKSIHSYNPEVACYPVSAITKFSADFWEALLGNLL